MNEIKTISLISFNDCTGCSACMNSCPADAIEMKLGEDSFLYPIIDKSKCIKCELCYKVCPITHLSEEINLPMKVYAGKSKERNLLLKSTSGGIFAEVANYVLKQEGVAFGCTIENDFSVRHISINNVTNLYRLQGSKYVQSEIGYTFREVKDRLEEKKLVVFSGTPCQVNGLKSYLLREYNNLITIDLICHGIPSNKMFKDYIKWIEDTKSIEIKDYTFRYKYNSNMICTAKMDYRKNSAAYSTKISYESDIFYHLFMYGLNYRKSCYFCNFRCKNRNSDITLGDYWGVEVEHKDISQTDGVSAILVNSNNGLKIINNSNLQIVDSDYNKVLKHNNSLIASVPYNKECEMVRKIYSNSGIEGLEVAYHKRFLKNKVLRVIKNCIPIEIRKKMRIKLGE